MPQPQPQDIGQLPISANGNGNGNDKPAIPIGAVPEPDGAGTATKAPPSPSLLHRFIQGAKDLPTSALASFIGVPETMLGPTLKTVYGWTQPLDHLDVVGGTIGEVLGGPLGTGIGMAGGGALSRLIHEVPEVPEAARDIARNLTQAPTSTPNRPDPTRDRRARGAIAFGTGAGALQGLSEGEKDAATDFGLGVGSSEVGIRGGAAAARSVMGKALGKIPPDVLKTFRTSTKEIAQTMLDRGINPTVRGLKKLDALFGETEDTLTKTLRAIKGQISPVRAANRVDDVVKKFSAANRLTPEEDQAAIAQTKAAFLAAHPDDLTGLEAQALKRGGYREIEEKAYGTGKLGTADLETRKAIIRGLREEIEGVAQKDGAGDVKALNDQERRLMAANDAIMVKLMRQPVLSPADLILVTKKPITATLAVADHLGISPYAVVAQAINQGAMTGVNSLFLRALVSGFAQHGEAQTASGVDVGTGGSPRGPTGSPVTPTNPQALLAPKSGGT